MKIIGRKETQRGTGDARVHVRQPRERTEVMSCFARQFQICLCCVIVYKTARLRNKHAAESMEHYSNFKRIGEGSYGEVYKAQDAKGQLVAVKKCRFKVRLLGCIGR